MKEISPRFGDRKEIDGVRHMYVGNGRWAEEATIRAGFGLGLVRAPHRTQHTASAITKRDLRCLMAEPRHPACRREIDHA